MWKQWLHICFAVVDDRSVQRSWWSTAASVAFFLFTITLALPQCARQKGMYDIHSVVFLKKIGDEIKCS